MNESPLELETRRRIYGRLKQTPGAHFSELQRDLGLATGTLQYHLRYLETKGLIDARQDGKYTRYYTSADVDRRWKPALGLLRQPTPRAIVVHLLEKGASPLSSLSEALGVPASTLSFHLKKLMDAGVVAKVARGTYGLLEPDAIVALLAEYRAGFLDAAVDRVVRLFTGAKPGRPAAATGPSGEGPSTAPPERDGGKHGRVDTGATKSSRLGESHRPDSLVSLHPPSLLARFVRLFRRESDPWPSRSSSSPSTSSSS